MATLGYHLKMCKLVFGENSKATQFIEKKIAEAPNGENEDVVADESQIIMVLQALNAQPDQDMYKEIKWNS
jgi:hypothetical protein